MPLGQDGAGPRRQPRAIGGEQDPSQSRVQRQPLQLPTQVGQPLRVDGSDPAEQSEGRFDRFGRRRIEPLQRAGIGAPGEHVEHDARQIDAVELGVAVGLQPIAFVPQAARVSGFQAPGAARALVGRVLRDAFGIQAVDRPIGIVPGHLVQAGVDDGRHAGHCQRRLGDVRRQDDAPVRHGADRLVLFRRVERAVQRHDLDVLAAQTARHLRGRAPDLAGARQERQHLPARLRQHVGHGVGQRLPGRVRDLHGMHTARHVDDRTVAEEGGHAGGIERRRHDDQAEVLAGEPGLARERQTQVGVNRPLVELVEDDRAEVGRERILLEAGGQDALGRDEQTGLRSELPIESHLPADLVARRPSLLVGDARGNRAGRDAARLQQQHGAVGRQRRRHARRLAGARQGGHDHRAPLADGLEDPGDERVDGERKHGRGL